MTDDDFDDDTLMTLPELACVFVGVAVLTRLFLTLVYP